MVLETCYVTVAITFLILLWYTPYVVDSSSSGSCFSATAACIVRRSGPIDVELSNCSTKKGVTENGVTLTAADLVQFIIEMVLWNFANALSRISSVHLLYDTGVVWAAVRVVPIQNWVLYHDNEATLSVIQLGGHCNIMDTGGHIWAISGNRFLLFGCCKYFMYFLSR